MKFLGLIVTKLIRFFASPFWSISYTGTATTKHSKNSKFPRISRLSQQCNHNLAQLFLPFRPKIWNIFGQKTQKTHFWCHKNSFCKSYRKFAIEWAIPNKSQMSRISLPTRTSTPTTHSWLVEDTHLFCLLISQLIRRRLYRKRNWITLTVWSFECLKIFFWVKNK